MSDLYDADIVTWSEWQADALRRRASNEIDWDNVAEEIESLGRSDKREIRNRLAVICEHLLKWQFQPDRRSGSWRGSVVEQRTRIAGLIAESPSLAAYPESVLTGAYSDGRAKAAAESGLGDLPGDSPWTAAQLLDPEFWPDEQQP